MTGYGFDFPKPYPVFFYHRKTPLILHLLTQIYTQQPVARASIRTYGMGAGSPAPGPVQCGPLFRQRKQIFKFTNIRSIFLLLTPHCSLLTESFMPSVPDGLR